MKLTVGVHLAPQYGDMTRLRSAWMEAEELGVDRIYTADHFHAMAIPTIDAGTAEIGASRSGKNFEATSIQAAMAVTTTRAEIGCLVHSNSYRNPNLLADISRTIDHLCNGRFILGIGSGYLKPDYDEYGYEFGTAGSRLRDLERDIPIIKARFLKLNPPPIRRIPFLIGALGEKLGLKIVAEHADIWHVFGPLEVMAQKSGVLAEWCTKVGRNPADIEHSATYIPSLLPDGDPDKYLDLGFTHIMVNLFGPEWDLGLLKELIAWKTAICRRRPELA